MKKFILKYLDKVKYYLGCIYIFCNNWNMFLGNDIVYDLKICVVDDFWRIYLNLGILILNLEYLNVNKSLNFENDVINV